MDLLGYSGFLPQSEDMQVRFIGDTKLSIGVCELFVYIYAGNAGMPAAACLPGTFQLSLVTIQIFCRLINVSIKAQYIV